jgi:hypothetical protein
VSADGDFKPVTFQVETPFDSAYLNPRMARNDARGLVEAVRPRTCIIVGSGPSARHPALWDRLDADPKGITTVACNGAYSVFAEYGHTPTYWTCCDPQDEVLNFLPENPNPRINYLLATKCPESLFDKLIAADCFVRAWRLDDMDRSLGKLHVMSAVSITLVTQNLMRLMGFHRFEMYGWDCCYIDGQHHASDQPEPEMPIDFRIADEETDATMHEFRITGAWAAELNDAVTQAHNFSAMGYELIVHGPGAVGALLRAKKLIA